MVEFYMRMIPPMTTYQQHKVAIIGGKPRFYEPEKVKAARESYMALLSKRRPEKPIEGPVRLTTKWLYPLTQKEEANHIDWCWKTSKPDTDNMIKLLKDCMTKCGYWKDDAQVVSEITEKFRTKDEPGIYVRIERLQDDIYR